MQDARDAGAIDKRTMRQFDESCLTRAEMLSAREIQRLRKREGVSQWERALEAPGSAWGPEVLGVPNTTFAWCNL
jgi:DNA-binding transcriptional regulator YiaG